GRWSWSMRSRCWRTASSTASRSAPSPRRDASLSRSRRHLRQVETPPSTGRDASFSRLRRHLHSSKQCERGAVSELIAWRLSLHARFRGLDVREGALTGGPAGWGEWSPFGEYGVAEVEPWLRCAEEAAAGDWPTPVREEVPV